VRGLVWSAEWDRELGPTKLFLDEITVDAFIDDDAVLAERLPPRAE